MDIVDYELVNSIYRQLADLNASVGMMSRILMAKESTKVGVITEEQYKDILSMEANAMYEYVKGGIEK